MKCIYNNTCKIEHNKKNKNKQPNNLKTAQRNNPSSCTYIKYIALLGTILLSFLLGEMSVVKKLLEEGTKTSWGKDRGCWEGRHCGEGRYLEIRECCEEKKE